MRHSNKAGEGRERWNLAARILLMLDRWYFFLRQRNTTNSLVSKLTPTHTQHLHAYSHPTGSEQVYEDRFKLLPIPDDKYFPAAHRYVEVSAVRAKCQTAIPRTVLDGKIDTGSAGGLSKNTRLVTPLIKRVVTIKLLPE